ncbi:MAG: hypothetical protein II820_04335 [Ruminiclostridium sp.]|nr:hypothetical protein [Ruminiclostridium sp.]
MYTTFGKANDRFGFSTGGAFNCAFKNDRLTVITGIVILALLVVAAISDLVYLGDNMASAGSQASAGMSEMIYGTNAGDAKDPRLTVWGGAINSGLAIIILDVLIITGIFALIAFVIVIMFLRRGRLYKFAANDETFTVTYPKKDRKTVEFRYTDIVGMTWETRKFPLAPECLDITVRTRIGDFDYRVILTNMARANGITETPFNIIREKIGLASKDETDLITRGIR